LQNPHKIRNKIEKVKQQMILFSTLSAQSISTRYSAKMNLNFMVVVDRSIEPLFKLRQELRGINVR